PGIVLATRYVRSPQYSSTSLCSRIHCGSNVPHSAHTETSPLLFRTRNEGRYSLAKRPMSPVRARPAPAPKDPELKPQSSAAFGTSAVVVLRDFMRLYPIARGRR
ncbi:unnamed protein product, partial [Laminaria digitata]